MGPKKDALNVLNSLQTAQFSALLESLYYVSKELCKFFVVCVVPCYLKDRVKYVDLLVHHARNYPLVYL